jgi:hypothetical protein
MNLFIVSQRDSAAGWANNNFYKGTDLVTCMQRVPTHEPWDYHENLDPNRFSLSRTDANNRAGQTNADGTQFDPDPSAATPYPAKAGPAIDRGTVHGKLFPWSTDRPFLDKVKQVSSFLKFDPLDLLGIMYNESAASMDPSKPNGHGFYGLIQMNKHSAEAVGTNVQALVNMTRVQQMDYVQKYFQYWKWPSSKVSNPAPIQNIYMTVFLYNCYNY